MLTDYLNEDLRLFVDDFVVSFLAWDIIVFFHKNSGVSITAEQLAANLGRREDDVKRESDVLADKGFLTDRRGAYATSGDEAMRQRAAEFYSALCDREKRLRILTAVLQKR